MKLFDYWLEHFDTNVQEAYDYYFINNPIALTVDTYRQIIELVKAGFLYCFECSTRIENVTFRISAWNNEIHLYRYKDIEEAVCFDVWVSRNDIDPRTFDKTQGSQLAHLIQTLHDHHFSNFNKSSS